MHGTSVNFEQLDPGEKKNLKNFDIISIGSDIRSSDKRTLLHLLDGLYALVLKSLTEEFLARKFRISYGWQPYK